MLKSVLQQLPSLRVCSKDLTKWMSTQIQATATPRVEQQPHTTEAAATTSTPSDTSTTEADKLYSRLEIECRGIDPAVLKSYNWFATTAAEQLGIEVGKCWALRKAQHDRLTLLKSVHIYKKHRVQYEIRTYFRFMHFHKLTGSTLDTFLEYIERNLPEGVALKVTKVELQSMPEHLTKPPTLDEGRNVEHLES